MGRLWGYSYFSFNRIINSSTDNFESLNNLLNNPFELLTKLIDSSKYGFPKIVIIPFPDVDNWLRNRMAFSGIPKLLPGYRATECNPVITRS